VNILPRAADPISGTQKLGSFQLPIISVRHPKGGQRFRPEPRHRNGCDPSLLTSKRKPRSRTNHKQYSHWRSEAQIRLSRSSQRLRVGWSTPTSFFCFLIRRRIRKVPAVFDHSTSQSIPDLTGAPTYPRPFRPVADADSITLALRAAGAYPVRDGYRRNGRRQIP
jgi:hypothetical protein